MSPTELLAQVRVPLQEVFGSRLKGMVLYGSEARGEGAPDSDIDILVLLEEPVHWADDLAVITRALYALQLEMADRPLHAIPVSETDYQRGLCDLFRVAQEEGIAV